MEPKININRQKLGDDEIESKKDFDALVKKFKEESIRDARARKTFPKMRKLVYTTVIAGFLVVCTVTISELTKNKTNDKTATNLKNNKTVLADNSTKKFVQPIKKEAKLPYSKYTVNANKGGVITHKTNSQITVPKAAFVKKDGKEVTGNVEIRYREMHDVADQLASGMPMIYDSLGGKYHFESAGMLDIKGYQNNEEVFIKPGKQLEMNMVSKKDGDRFNVYYLDTVGKKWDYQGKDKIVSIDEFKKTEDLVHPSSSNLTTPKMEQIMVNIQDLEDEKKEKAEVTENKIAALPTPVEPEKPVASNKARKQFKLDVDYKQFPELKSFAGCLFEVDEENTNYNKEFSTITWSDVYITEGTKKGKNYTLNLSLNKRHEKLIVYPVFSGARFNEVNALYEKKFSEYQTALAERKTKEQKYEQELQNELKKIDEEQKKWYAKLDEERKKQNAEVMASVTNAQSDADLSFQVRRVFQINKFGVFNTDCAQQLPKGTVTEAEFVSGQHILRPNVAYLVDFKRNIMYTYELKDLENFRYDKDVDYQIVTTVNNDLYICDPVSFKNAENNGDKTLFNFAQINMDLVSADELRKKLGV